MKRSGRATTTGWTWVLAALGLCAHGAAAWADERRGHFHGSVQVAEDGALRVERLDGVSGALAQAVRSQLEARRALPATREGRPVASVAPLTGSVRLVPEGEQYMVALEHVALNPAPVQRAPISYPADALRENRTGTVQVEFALSADGTPVDVVVLESSHRYFTQAVTRTLGKWRYATVGMEPGRRFRMGVAFGTESRRPDADFACTADTAHARFEDEAPCIDVVTVTGSRVQRGTAVF